MTNWIARLRTHRRLAIISAVLFGLFAAAVPFVTLMNFDPNIGLPKLQPAPSVAVQKMVVAEFRSYPTGLLRFTSAIPRGADARGLATLLSQMQLTNEEGDLKTYRFVLSSTTPVGEMLPLTIEAVVQLDGRPQRVVSVWIDKYQTD